MYDYSLDLNILIAIIAAITFVFTMINIYISNYWSEIANHRNATLVNVPHLEYCKEKKLYKNSSDATAKYIKLYEFNSSGNYYSKYNDKSDEQVECSTISEINKDILIYFIEKNNQIRIDDVKFKVQSNTMIGNVKNTVKAEEVAIPPGVCEKLNKKLNNDTNYSNIIIHTDFSQRNIFIIYTYKKDKEIKSKRFTPMSYDMNYDNLIGQENINMYLDKLWKNDEIYKQKQKEFINTVIQKYKDRMYI